MDLNKLTKKELVEYGESMNRFLNIRDKKVDLIASIEQIEMFEEVNDSIRRKNTGEKDSIQVRSLKKKIKHLEERRDSERINSQIRTNELINEGKEEVKSDIKTVFVIIGIFLLFAFYLSTLPSENI
jgi:hypothetical protein